MGTEGPWVNILTVLTVLHLLILLQGGRIYRPVGRDSPTGPKPFRSEQITARDSKDRISSSEAVLGGGTK